MEKSEEAETPSKAEVVQGARRLVNYYLQKRSFARCTYLPHQSVEATEYLIKKHRNDICLIRVVAVHEGGHDKWP